MAKYLINKGIGKPAEFQGLKSQYLFIFAGGLLAVFVLVLFLFMIGINQFFCVIFGLVSGSFLVYTTFRMNKKYGEHGLMKLQARSSYPNYLINRLSIRKLVRKAKRKEGA